MAQGSSLTKIVAITPRILFGRKNLNSCEYNLEGKDPNSAGLIDRDLYTVEAYNRTTQRAYVKTKEGIVQEIDRVRSTVLTHEHMDNHVIIEKVLKVTRLDIEAMQALTDQYWELDPLIGKEELIRQFYLMFGQRAFGSTGRYRQVDSTVKGRDVVMSVILQYRIPAFHFTENPKGIFVPGIDMVIGHTPCLGLNPASEEGKRLAEQREFSILFGTTHSMYINDPQSVLGPRYINSLGSVLEVKVQRDRDKASGLYIHHSHQALWDHEELAEYRLDSTRLMVPADKVMTLSFLYTNLEQARFHGSPDGVSLQLRHETEKLKFEHLRLKNELESSAKVKEIEVGQIKLEHERRMMEQKEISEVRNHELKQQAESEKMVFEREKRSWEIDRQKLETQANELKLEQERFLAREKTKQVEITEKQNSMKLFSQVVEIVGAALLLVRTVIAVQAKEAAKAPAKKLFGAALSRLWKFA